MILYILKFSACLAVFMLFYKLFLEKESIHKFKRFYLLGALLLAVVIPLITFTTYVEATPIEIPINNSEFVTPPYVPEHMFEEETNYLPYLLWSIYGLGVLIFALRFGINLFKIVKRIKQNPKFKNQSVIHVLLHDLIQPHTFLNYVFFNKREYEANEIPQEVMLHEETHAKEKHALDIICIEILQIVFWFNPLLYFIKKDIKLNHEFLADKAVLNHGVALENYQNTLLAFSSNAKEPQLANAINYSSIKKRFTVMKTHTSKHTIWLRSLILLPLLAILIYSFSSNKVVEKEIPQDSTFENSTIPILEIYQDPLEFKLNGKATSIEKLNNDLTKITKGEKSDLIIDSKGENIDYEVIKKILFELKENLGDAKLSDGIIHDSNKYELVKNDNGTSSIVSISQKQQTNPLPKIYGRVCDGCEISLTKKEIENLTIETNTKEPIISFNIKFSGKPTVNVKGNKLNRKAISYLKNSKNGDNIQLFYLKTATAIIKTATTQIKSPVVIKLIDKSELPPPPPPPIPANATKEQKEKYQKVSEEYYKKYKVENGKVSEREPLPPEPPKPVKVEVPPPPPKSPLDHVVDMAKEGATFFYEEKQISSDKAIAILKSNKSINISTKKSSSKKPKVYLSKEPITIKEK